MKLRGSRSRQLVQPERVAAVPLRNVSQAGYVENRCSVPSTVDGEGFGEEEGDDEEKREINEGTDVLDWEESSDDEVVSCLEASGSRWYSSVDFVVNSGARVSGGSTIFDLTREDGEEGPLLLRQGIGEGKLWLRGFLRTVLPSAMLPQPATSYL